MPRLDATGLSIGFATIALSASAAAQSGFRPLPHLPRLDPWLAVTRGSEPEAVPAAPLPAAEGELTTTLDAQLFGGMSSESDLEGGGSVATQRGGWAATLGRKLDGDSVAALELSAEADFYEFSGATTIVAGDTDPFNDLYRAALSGQLHTQLDRRVGYFAGLELELAGEEDASLGESLSVGAAGGITVSSGEQRSLSLGLAAMSQLEDDLWLWPWLGFEWRPNEWLEFEMRGTELESRIALGAHWTALARIDYTLRQFRLNDDNPLRGGALRDEDIRAGVGLQWHVDDGVEIGVLGGLSLWRELTTFDGRGGEVEQELDRAPFVGFKLSMSL